MSPVKWNFSLQMYHRGISSLSNFHESPKLARLVQVKTLGMMIENLKIQTINLLKIDAEGFDLKVLKGINFSDKLNLDIIICEFEDKKTLRLNYSVLDHDCLFRTRGLQSNSLRMGADSRIWNQP